MQFVSTWSSANPIIEMVGDEDDQSICKHPVVGAASVRGLSHNPLIRFLLDLQGLDAA